jgi:signal transduction histidine kinase
MFVPGFSLPLSDPTNPVACRSQHEYMKQKIIPLRQQYLAALEKHLKQGPRASLLPALNLGRGAVALGLETLDLARMHEQALATLELSHTKNGFTKLAGIFFTEANTAIEETHRAARQTKVDLGKLMATLGRRTEELAVSNRQLKRGVDRRKVMEDDFATRRKHHQKCLEESLELQNRLRRLTHQVLAAQEDERKKISRELQDEIAQTLLGINVRLLSLKQAARNNTIGLKNTIASTQRLVANSARTVRQVGRKIGGL